jgi:hypothetical protein
MLRVPHILMALAVAGVAGTVQADPPWARDGGDERGHKQQREHERDDRHHESRHRDEYHDHWRDEDRGLVRDFYRQNPHQLPPGLAKKGGMPPGLAKKGGMPPGLARGEVVTADHERYMSPLPRELEIRLPPPPHEVIRRIIGHDIVMINKINHKVLDVLHDALP